MKTLRDILSEGNRYQPKRGREKAIFDHGDYAVKSNRRYNPGHDPVSNIGAALYKQPHEVPNRQKKATSKAKKPKFDIAAMAKRLAARHNKGISN